MKNDGFWKWFADHIRDIGIDELKVFLFISYNVLLVMVISVVITIFIPYIGWFVIPLLGLFLVLFLAQLLYFVDEWFG